MKMFYRVLGLVVIGGLLASSAEAQIVVRGTGKLMFDVALTQAEAQAQVYRVYLDASPTGIVVPVTCAGDSPSVCTTPLTGLGLPNGQTVTIALTATIVAADGDIESAKSPAITVKKTGPPQNPTWSVVPVVP